MAAMAVQEPDPSDEPAPELDARDWAGEDAPRLSPSALNRFLGCEYRTYLDLLDRRGELDAERRPPRLQLLLDRGQRHEDDVLDGLLAEGRDVVSIKDENATVEERAGRTLEA